jgi:hypothetical protein
MRFELNLRKRNIPKGELIADLPKVASEIGQTTLTAARYAERGKHGTNTMLRRFGSWNQALSAAGLGLNNRINIPDEELFENSGPWSGGQFCSQPLRLCALASLRYTRIASFRLRPRVGRRSWPQKCAKVA